ncbi:Hypothetical protein GLP15_2947 [Giardia lamblia P15]|uniref:Uncharacterized protein n=1 Tax=Giardia intestinalis (strain P15) TaxID=658858 RepID=E1F925_GIAIA|nr:Hypothetical protein GLP15_2947 [Giardia lamblia P15]
MPLTIPKYIQSPSDSYSLTYISNQYSDGPVRYSSRFLCSADKAQMNNLASLQQQEILSCLDSFHRITDSYCHRLETWVRENPAEYERFLMRLASQFNLSVDDERIYSLAADSVSRLPSMYSGRTPKMGGSNYSNLHLRPVSGKALRNPQRVITPLKVNSPKPSKSAPDFQTNSRSKNLSTCMEQRHYVNKNQLSHSLPESVVSLRVHVGALNSHEFKVSKIE